MLKLLNKVKKLLKELYRRLRRVSWFGAIVSILKTVRRKDTKVESKYLVIKHRILSDENYLRGVSVIRSVLTLIPPAAIAAPILGLGAMGFKIWKRIALSQDYNQILYPPVDPNMLRLSIALDTELNKQYGQLILDVNWNEESISRLESIYNDFQFLTNFEMLRIKYPEVDEEYIRDRVGINQHNLQMNLDAIEQEVLKVSHKAEINHNVREAFGLFKELFPVMNDWALFNSEGFDDILELLDTIF